MRFQAAFQRQNRPFFNQPKNALAFWPFSILHLDLALLFAFAKVSSVILTLSTRSKPSNLPTMCATSIVAGNFSTGRSPLSRKNSDAKSRATGTKTLETTGLSMLNPITNVSIWLHSILTLVNAQSRSELKVGKTHI